MTFEDEVDEAINHTSHIMMPVAYEFAGHLFFAVVSRKVEAVVLDGRHVRLSTSNAKPSLGAILRGCVEDHQGFIATQMDWAYRRAEASNGLILVHRRNPPVKAAFARLPRRPMISRLGA